MTQEMQKLQAIKTVLGRGYFVGGTGLFQGEYRLTMYRTRRQAEQHAKRFGWRAIDACQVFDRIFGGWAVAQNLYDSLRFLCDDGTTLDWPLEKTQVEL